MNDRNERLQLKNKRQTSPFECNSIYAFSHKNIHEYFYVDTEKS